MSLFSQKEIYDPQVFYIFDASADTNTPKILESMTAAKLAYSVLNANLAASKLANFGVKWSTFVSFLSGRLSSRLYGKTEDTIL